MMLIHTIGRRLVLGLVFFFSIKANAWYGVRLLKTDEFQWSFMVLLLRCTFFFTFRQRLYELNKVY